MFKRSIALLLILAMCFNLCGCGVVKDLLNGKFDLFATFPFLKNLIPKFTISFDLNYDNAPNSVDEQKVSWGELASLEIPHRDSYAFVGWYTDRSFRNFFDFSTKKIYHSYKLFARWVDISDMTDTDSDGLADVLEKLYKTNIKKADTDDDKLTDYEEIEFTKTNPLKKDTDKNGVKDGDEDADEDGLINLEEIKFKTNLALKDSDGDTLSDYDECNTYTTNPNNNDTDGDGAADNIEIAYKTDPLIAENEFIQVVESAEISENNPVSVKVTADVTGTVMGSVCVQTVTAADNALISSNIPGYLGTGYEFTASGPIEQAKLEFSYDTSIWKIGNNFQPRIYYLNEATNMLEELPDQVVSKGKVTAYTSHFSTYILLNKVAFETVWENEIKPPIIDVEGNPTNLDVGFAIDVSGSMRGDRISTAKNALNTFIDALSDNDRAAVVKFNSSAQTMCSLSNEKKNIKSRINALSEGGLTSMYTGFEKALDILTERGQNYGYRMIIILSDGKDEPSTSYAARYSNLVDRAVNNGITVYTIGVGSTVDTSTLTKIANATGGAYYHATSVGDLMNVFDSLQEETVDLVTDSNSDGIPDYFNNLIYTGELRLSSGAASFAGYDFNTNDDFDGDGLKNGEELIVSVENGRVYMKMFSNPLLVDSDYDGYGDKIEKELKMNPLKFSFSHAQTDSLFDDEMYCGHLLAQKYRDNIALQLSTQIVNTLSKNFIPEKECQQVYINYFNDCASQSVDENEHKNSMYIIADNVNSILEFTNDKILEEFSILSNIKDSAEKLTEGKKISEKIKSLFKARDDSVKILNKINLTGKNFDEKTTNNLITSMKEVMNNLGAKFPQVKNLKIKIGNLGESVKKLNNSLNTNVIGNINRGDIITFAITTGMDVTNTITTYAKLSANQNAYEDNLDILDYLANHTDSNAIRSAAQNIYSIIDEGYLTYLAQFGECVLKDIAKGGIDLVTSQLVLSNPYTTTIMLVFNVLDLAFGFSHKAERTNHALYLDALASAVRILSKRTLQETQYSYDSIFNNPSISNRYLTHLAQVRITQERNFIVFAENEGWLSALFDKDYNEAKAFCEDTISVVRTRADNMSLQLADAFRN